MDEREFFDKLFQAFTKTTFAEKRYWDFEDTGDGFAVRAVGEDGETELVAGFVNEPDADFVTAIHGCFPDLYRRVLAALDEAERADRDRDARECRIAELELENQSLRKEVLTA